MKRSITKHLSFANVMTCFAVFIALGGSAYAVGKNTIGTKQIKNNAVTAKKIKKNAVTAAKIKKNAVTAAKVKGNAITAAKIKDGSITSGKIADGAVTGAKVDVASLGQVPSAASAAKADVATEAGSLVGQQNFFVKLNGGEQKVLATYGQVTLTAKCEQNNVNNLDVVSLIASTSTNGAILNGDESLYGGPDPSDFLNTDTPENDRVLESESEATNATYVGRDIDSGYILGTDGKAILLNTEAVILGVNYLGSRCITGGVLNFLDAS